MAESPKNALRELQQVISRMPLSACCTTVVQEFDVPWRLVSRVIRNYRLPIAPSSVARVLCQHARSFPKEELAVILTRLRLMLVAYQQRKWYVVDMSEPNDEDMSMAELIQALPGRVAQALQRYRGGRAMAPEVETILMDDLLYMSVQLVSERKVSPVLFVIVPLGQLFILSSSLTSGLLKGCVEGLGYGSFADSQLCGLDVRSLMRVRNAQHDELVDCLVAPPPYQPEPVVTATGIDYTYKTYNEKYVDDILGPNPPLLTELTMQSTKNFYDPSRLNKKINLTVHIKTENLAKSLKSFVTVGALSPTSDLFEIFHKVKSNKIAFQDDDDE